MPQTTDDGEGGVQEKRTFHVPMMYHPSHDVLDLAEAERWYERIFGAPSQSLASIIAKLPPLPGSGYPPDYSTFTLISDVLMDTIDPTRYVIDGVQRLASVAKPHLRLISWYVEGMNEACREIRRHGIRIADQLDQIVEVDEAPTAFGSAMPQFYTLAADAGLRFAFSPPAFVKPSDPRSDAGWTGPSPAQQSPLGIVCCSHHTILTNRPERGIKLLRDALGGNVVHQARNELLCATSTFVHLGGSTIEYAVPDAGTAAYEDWQERAPDDTYHSITWMVSDLGHAKQRLTAYGVEVRSESRDALITDPATSLGIPWGFTTSLVPGDPRSTAKAGKPRCVASQ